MKNEYTYDQIGMIFITIGIASLWLANTWQMENQIEDTESKFTKVETVLLPKRSKNVSVIGNGYEKHDDHGNVVDVSPQTK